MSQNESEPSEFLASEKTVLSCLLEHIPALHKKSCLVENRPSRADRVPLALETKWLCTSIRLVHMACKRLNLNHNVSHTASVLFHQFFATRSMQISTDRYYFTTACIHLAAKLESHAVSAELVGSACHAIRVGRDSNKLAQLTDQTFLVSEVRCLLACESDILRSLGSSKAIFVHPFEIVTKALNCLNLLDLSPRLQASDPKKYAITVMLLSLTVNSINDSRFTSLCLQYPPETLGMAALWLSLQEVMKRFPEFHLLPPDVEFCDFYGLDLTILLDVQAQMLAMSAHSFTYKTEAGSLPLTPAAPQQSVTQTLLAKQQQDQRQQQQPRTHPLFAYTEVQRQQINPQQPPAAAKPVAAAASSATSEQTQQLDSASALSSQDTVMLETASTVASELVANMTTDTFESIPQISKPQSTPASAPAPTLAQCLTSAGVSQSPSPMPRPAFLTGALKAASASLQNWKRLSLARAGSANPCLSEDELSVCRKTLSQDAIIKNAFRLEAIWSCEPRHKPERERWCVRTHATRTWRKVETFSATWTPMPLSDKAVANLQQVAMKRAAKQVAKKAAGAKLQSVHSPLEAVPSCEPLSKKGCRVGHMAFTGSLRWPVHQVVASRPHTVKFEACEKEKIEGVHVPVHGHTRCDFTGSGFTNQACLRESGKPRTLSAAAASQAVAAAPALKEVSARSVAAASAAAVRAVRGAPPAAVAAPERAEFVAPAVTEKFKLFKLHFNPASPPLSARPVSSQCAPVSPVPASSCLESQDASLPCPTFPFADPSPACNITPQASCGNSRDKAADGSICFDVRRPHNKTCSSNGGLYRGMVCESEDEDGAPKSPQSRSATQMPSVRPETAGKRYRGETNVLLPEGAKQACYSSICAETQAEEEHTMPPPPPGPQRPPVQAQPPATAVNSPTVPPSPVSQAAQELSSVQRARCTITEENEGTSSKKGSPPAVRPCTTRVGDPSCAVDTAHAPQDNSEVQQQQPEAAVAAPSAQKRKREEGSFDEGGDDSDDASEMNFSDGAFKRRGYEIAPSHTPQAPAA